MHRLIVQFSTALKNKKEKRNVDTHPWPLKRETWKSLPPQTKAHSNLPQKQSLANLPVLMKLSPWNEGAPGRDSEAAAAEYWKALKTRQRKDHVNLQAKWQERYQIFLTARAGRWYKEITRGRHKPNY
jgi:hypothetical protein